MDTFTYVSNMFDPTCPAEIILQEMERQEPASEAQYRYLSMLAHKKYPKMSKYNLWQKQVTKKYSLWRFSDISREQASLEIKSLL